MKKLLCLGMTVLSVPFLSAQVSYSIKGIDVQKGYIFPSNPREINSFNFKAAVPVDNNGDWATILAAFSYDGKIFPVFSYGGKIYVVDGSELIIKDLQDGYLYKNDDGEWSYRRGSFKKDGIEIEGHFFSNKFLDEFIEKIGQFTDQKILSGKTYRYTFGTQGSKQMLIIYGGQKI